MGDFIIENGCLKKYVGAGGDVVIPDGVTEIGAGAFMACESLKSIKISNSVKVIKHEAFKDCCELTRVSLPEKILIGESAFHSCWALEEVIIPNHADIMERSFACCTSLERVVFPDKGMIFLAEEAFAECELIGSVHLGNAVWRVKERAFLGTDITKLYIAESVTSIAQDAFSWVYNVTYEGTEEQFYEVIYDLPDELRGKMLDCATYLKDN